MRLILCINTAIVFSVFMGLMTALSAAPVIITESLAEQNITANLEYVIDSEQNLSLTELRNNQNLHWLHSNEAYIGRGYVEDVVWLRLQIKNALPKAKRFVLEESFSLTDIFELYIPRKDGTFTIIRTGALFPFNYRPLNHRTLPMELSIPAGQTYTYYLRYKTTDNFIISLKVRSLDNFDEYRLNENAIMWLYYGAMLIMLVYNGFLLVSVRDLSYLFYITYLGSIGMVLMVFNGHAFQHLWPNEPGWNRILMPILDSTAVASLILFIRYFIEIWKYNKTLDRVSLFVAYAFLGGALLFPLIPIYQVAIQLLFAALSLGAFFMLCILLYFAFYLRTRPAYFLLLASVVLILGLMLFALQVTQILPKNVFTTYGVQLGSVIDVALLSFALADKINYLRKMRDKAENKYKHLVESANEIIFTLDKDYKFLTVNSALQQHLGFLPEDIIGKHFSNFIYEIKGELHNYSRNIVQEYLNNIRTEKGTTTFKTNLKGLYNLEPGPFNIRLQYVELNDDIEILGRASPDMEDALFDDIREETQYYDMSNFFSNADLISHRLTKYIEKFMPATDVLSLRLALREILINSIEHGNLGMSFEEKSEALERMDYFEVLRSRQNDPKNVDKKVRIEYSLTANRIAVRITDAGGGFDHQLFFSTAEKNAREGRLLHGRGLIMCKNEFDYMNFNEKGNSITVVKYLSEHREPPEEIFPS